MKYWFLIIPLLFRFNSPMQLLLQEKVRINEYLWLDEFILNYYTWKGRFKFA